MKVDVIKGSIIEVDVEVIVNPANSYGVMGGGVAGVIKRFGGREVEESAREKSPIPVGSAILTSAGKLPFKGIIHAPTMERPAMATDRNKVKSATLAALKLADKEGFESIAIPGMGTGVGRVPKDVSATAMMEAAKEFSGSSLKRVVFVDIDQNMVKEWEKAKYILQET